MIRGTLLLIMGGGGVLYSLTLFVSQTFADLGPCDSNFAMPESDCFCRQFTSTTWGYCEGYRYLGQQCLGVSDPCDPNQYEIKCYADQTTAKVVCSGPDCTECDPPASNCSMIEPGCKPNP